MILIQSRLGSQRLPRKSEKLVLGIALLERVVRQCLKARNHHTVLCVPVDEKSDLFYSSISEKYPALFLWFGSGIDVAERFRGAFQEFQGLFDNEPKGTGLVRVCGDRPFLSTHSLNDTFHEKPKKLELLYNHLPSAEQSKPGPQGLGIESLSQALARRLFVGDLKFLLHPEHVTTQLYDDSRVRASHHLPPKHRNWWRSLSGDRFDLDSDNDLQRLNSLSSRTVSALEQGGCF